MTRRAPYTQADVQRAAKALEGLGKTVVGVEHLPTGGFRVLTAEGQPKKALSPLEAWEQEHGHRAA